MGGSWDGVMSAGVCWMNSTRSIGGIQVVMEDFVIYSCADSKSLCLSSIRGNV